MSSDAPISEFVVSVSEKGGLERRATFRSTPITFGRVQGNDLVLPKGNVSKRHARVTYAEGRFVVSDLNSTNGTYVNRQKIAQPTILRDDDKIQIGDFTIRISSVDEDRTSFASLQRDSVEAPPPPVDYALPVQHPSSSPPREEVSRASLPSPSPRLSEPPGEPSQPSQRFTEHATGLRRSVALVWERIVGSAKVPLQHEPAQSRELRERVSQIVDQLLVDGLIPVGVSASSVLDHAYAELCDWGPLRELLRDPQVSLVSALRFDEVLETRDGRAQLSVPGFSSTDAMNLAIERIFAVAKEVQRDGVVVVATLPDGARISRLSPEVSASGPLFVMEKVRRATSTLDELVRRGTVSRAVATFLGQAVQARLNILVVGPKDEGHASLVGALAHASTLGPSRERIVCGAEPEDVELEPEAMFRVELPRTLAEVRRVYELVGSVPGSRLVLGLRDPEQMALCLEGLGANASGLIASYRGTNVARAMARLPADLAAIRGQSPIITADWLASTFDVVVEVARLRDGRVRVLRVAELELGEGGRIEVTDIFRFSVSRLAAGGAVEGTFSPSGVVPRALAQLQLQGLRVETSVFSRPPSK